jgi:hypothetical protein
MCGTSVTQIENTYRHIDRETMLTNALADHYIDGMGRVIPRTAPGWSGVTTTNRLAEIGVRSRTMPFVKFVIKLPRAELLLVRQVPSGR